jgi:acyl carrier protein
LAEQRAGAGRPSGNRDLLARLAAAEPGARAALLLEVLRGLASEVLRLPEGKLEVEAPLTSLGMDSLMGLELRNRIEAALGITVSATLLWTYPTVTALSVYVAGQTGVAGNGEAVRPPDTREVTPLDHEVSHLEKDDLLALLDAELALAGEQ